MSACVDAGYTSPFSPWVATALSCLCCPCFAYDDCRQPNRDQDTCSAEAQGKIVTEEPDGGASKKPLILGGGFGAPSVVIVADGKH